MLPYFWYILKLVICSGILFGYYWLFLRNKIFHQYNRFYLLTALVLSLLLPLLKIDFWQQDNQHSQVIKALQVVSVSDDYMNNVIISANKESWSAQQLYPLLYWAVSITCFLVLLQTFFAIRSLLKKHPVQKIDDISFVNTNDKSTPFSFLQYIFWNAGIDMDTFTGKQIFKHELVHVKEKHTYDKLFINILLVFFWCNPFFWLYRKELNMIHEFIADKKAVENSDTSAFAAMILQATYPQHRFPITNNFFYSPIKRRIAMLTKKKNPRLSYIARIMVLPLAVIVFAAFSFKVKDRSPRLKGMASFPLLDTLPSNAQLPTGAQWATAADKSKVEEIDPEKALLIMNGKVMGKGAGAANNGEFNQIVANSITVTWLQRKDAIAKYGSDGADGACEVSYVDAIAIKTAYVDENKLAVFYVGMDNLLTVVAQNVKAEDLVVNVSAGKILGINGKYIVKVSHPGEVTLSFSKRDGTTLPGKFVLKAKLLPDPANENLKAYNPRNNTDTVPADVQERMLIEKKALEEKQKILLNQYSKVQLDRAEKELLLKSTNEAIRKTTLENKLKSQDLAKEKKLLLEEYNRAKLNDLQKEQSLKLSKTQLDILENKLKNQDLLKEKQKMLVEEYTKEQLATNEKLFLLKSKDAAMEKVLLEQKQLLLEKPNEDLVFVKTEQSPQFTGGEEAWKKYLQQHLKAGTPVDEGWKAGVYKVIIKFIVHTDGSVSDVQAENYKGSKTALHCIDIIKNAPKWQPAVQNGKKVNAFKKQPITFVIEEQ